jgi:hypothetical protein
MYESQEKREQEAFFGVQGDRTMRETAMRFARNLGKTTAKELIDDAELIFKYLKTGEK